MNLYVLGIMCSCVQCAALVKFMQSHLSVVTSMYAEPMFLIVFSSTLFLHHFFCFLYIYTRQRQIDLWILERCYGQSQYPMADTSVCIVGSCIGWSVMLYFSENTILHYTGLGLLLAGYAGYYPVIVLYNRFCVSLIVTLALLMASCIALICVTFQRDGLTTGCLALQWTSVFLFTLMQLLVAMGNWYLS